MKVPAALVRKRVREWMLLRPLRFLRLYRRPGIEVFLRKCTDNGIRIGAFSDYPTHEKVEALGLSPWFKLHLCSTDPEINAFKPSAEGILLACKKWKLVPKELLYVGDRAEIDAVTAAAAGARFVLIGKPQNPKYFAVIDFFELAGCL
jgi:FMN phosphatase YigB (HAD superfamily)